MLDKYSEIIEARAVRMLKPATDDYASQIWHLIEEDVVADVLECTNARQGYGFTDGDIALAIGRELLNRLRVMTPNQYQEAAMRTANPQCKNLSNVGLGIAGEAGEVADLIKKHLHHGHELDKDHLVKELGDVAWYMALGCDVVGVDLETVLRMNVEKLKARYPDGFDSGHSLHRAEGDV